MSANANNVSYICVKDAVERGFGSRVTIMRWVKDASVRSFRRGSFRMVCVEDLEARVASRERVVTVGRARPAARPADRERRPRALAVGQGAPRAASALGPCRALGEMYIEMYIRWVRAGLRRTENMPSTCWFVWTHVFTAYVGQWLYGAGHKA